MNISGANYSLEDFQERNELSSSPWIVAVRVMRSVCIPMIVCVGLCGNTLSLLVFLAKSMRRSACSVFLAALAVVDNAFLISLSISWIDGQIITLLSTDLACQLLVYITYVASFLSAWFIVGFTCERYIAICFPLHSNYLCSVFRQKVTVYILAFVALVIYNFSFWTTDSTTKDVCIHKIEYLNFLNVVTWVDTFLTMVIPFIIIAFVNSLVLRAVAKCKLKPKERPVLSYRMKRMRSVSTPDLGECRTFINASVIRPLQGAKRVNHQIRVTRTLLFVSSTFLILNLPAHVLRLFNLIASFTSTAPTVSDKLYFMQEVTAMLYYTTFSCNFFLYTLFGRNFKTSLFLILRCKSTTTFSHRQLLLRRFSYSRHSSRSSCLTSL